MSENLRILVAVPTSGMCKSWFAYSWAQLMIAAPTMLNKYRPEAQIEMLMSMVETSVIHVNREMLAKQAIDQDATHLLFLDDDMVFDPNAVALLIGRRHAFVGCNYPKRGWPITFTAIRPDKCTAAITDKDSCGIEEVSYTGFGCTLIETQVFKKTPQPWFLPLFMEQGGGIYTTEDAPFCERIREAGFKCYVDHDASKHIGHCGSHTYKWDQWRAPQATTAVTVQGTVTQTSTSPSKNHVVELKPRSAA